jgi:hypothetical protein
VHGPPFFVQRHRTCRDLAGLRVLPSVGFLRACEANGFLTGSIRMERLNADGTGVAGWDQFATVAPELEMTAEEFTVVERL